MSTRVTVESQFTRNYGFISHAQQAAIANATISIAGVGGVGGRVATELARLGCLNLRLADPDIFTLTNLNRQEGAYVSTLGKSKAETIAALCRDINPDITIKIYDAGIDETNVVDFVQGATIIVEATDFMLPNLGVMLARQARSHNVPLVMGVEIGFGATFTWFKPDGYTYENYFGLPKNVSLADLSEEKIIVDFRRWLPHVPLYGDIAVLRKVASGKVDVPVIAPAVGICSALITTEILNLLGREHSLPPAPSVYCFDAREHKSRIVRYRMLHHRWSLAMMVLNNLLGRNDKM